MTTYSQIFHREDEADEYRVLKRELETYAKNCRVLSFKLKKAEKSLTETAAEKTPRSPSASPWARRRTPTSWARTTSMPTVGAARPEAWYRA